MVSPARYAARLVSRRSRRLPPSSSTVRCTVGVDGGSAAVAPADVAAPAVDSPVVGSIGTITRVPPCTGGFLSGDCLFGDGYGVAYGTAFGTGAASLGRRPSRRHPANVIANPRSVRAERRAIGRMA